jgi:hypothetical protein
LRLDSIWHLVPSLQQRDLIGNGSGCIVGHPYLTER